MTSVGRETISVSLWIVKKPLHIVSLICDTTFPEVKSNALLNQLRDEYIRLSSSARNPEILHFISKEFSKVVANCQEYLISATVATDLVTDMGYDGIVYPSVPMGGQAGMNIVLTPKAVNRKLQFVKVLEQTLYKNGSKSILRLEKENGKKLKNKQFPNAYIEQELNINSLSDLPIVE